MCCLSNAGFNRQTGQFFSINRAEFSDSGPSITTFENPLGNTRTMYLENVLGGIQLINSIIPRDYEETLSVSLFEVVVTARNMLTPSNLNLGSPDFSSIVVGVPTGLEIVKALSFSRHPTGEFSLDFNGRIVIPPGYSFLLQVGYNLAANRLGALSLSVTWREA